MNPISNSESASKRGGRTLQKQDRIAEIDVLRGISIIGVLFIHSSFNGRFSAETLSIQAAMARIFDWAVLGFFFCSGILHRPSAQWLQGVKKRAVSLLLPFCLYNVLYNLIFVVLALAGLFPKGDHEINGQLLLRGWLESPAFQLYFLVYLFLISMLISALDNVFPRFRAKIYIAILFCIVLFYQWRGYPESSHGAELYKFPLYFAAFLVGSCCQPMLKNRISHWKSLAIVALAAGLLGVFKQPSVSLALPPLLLALALACPIISGAAWLIYLGQKSGSIYLWHTPLILPLITRFLAGCHCPSLGNLFLSVMLTLFFCILLRIGLDIIFQRLGQRAAPQWIVL